MKKFKIITLVFLLIFLNNTLQASSKMFMVLFNQSIGIGKDLSQKINDTPYHKFFSLGGGPFLPIAGFGWRWEVNNYTIIFDFAGGTSPGETDFGAPLNLSTISFTTGGEYPILIHKRIILYGVGSISFLRIIFTNPYFSDSSQIITVRGGVNTKMIISNSGNLNTFMAFECGFQYPSNLNISGLDDSLQPYYFKISFGIGR